MDYSAAIADYSDPSFAAGGTDAWGVFEELIGNVTDVNVNTFEFAPDDPEERLKAWDGMTEYDPSEEIVFSYVTNGEKAYLVWNFEVVFETEYTTADELKKAVEEGYLQEIIVRPEKCSCVSPSPDTRIITSHVGGSYTETYCKICGIVLAQTINLTDE